MRDEHNLEGHGGWATILAVDKGFEDSTSAYPGPPRIRVYLEGPLQVELDQGLSDVSNIVS